MGDVSRRCVKWGSGREPEDAWRVPRSGPGHPFPRGGLDADCGGVERAHNVLAEGRDDWLGPFGVGSAVGGADRGDCWRRAVNRERDARRIGGEATHVEDLGADPSGGYVGGRDGPSVRRISRQGSREGDPRDAVVHGGFKEDGECINQILPVRGVPPDRVDRPAGPRISHRGTPDGNSRPVVGRERPRHGACGQGIPGVAEVHRAAPDRHPVGHRLGERSVVHAEAGGAHRGD